MIELLYTRIDLAVLLSQVHHGMQIIDEKA